MRLKIFSLALAFSLNAASMMLDAGITIQNGKIVDATAVATMPMEGHFNAGLYAMERDDWREAERHFYVVTVNFPCTQYGHESFYFLGVAQYYLNELDLSNDSFTEYLKGKLHPKYFVETLQYKFNIAEKFRCGAYRRFFGTKQLPKWASGYSLALEIYDEIITTLPCHELAVRALFSKGYLQWEQKNYRDSVDAFRMLTRRFPKHELAPESYLIIMAVYLEQSRTEFQNPDILALAQITLRKFEQAFPREERIEDAKAYFLSIEEHYAKGLFDTGAFYERTGKPTAAAIYYQNAANLFPGTHVAVWCNSHLERLRQCGVEIYLPGKAIDSEDIDSLEDLDETDNTFMDIELTDLDDDDD